jgi:polysaccharide biosynthesis transport protein
MLTAFQVEKPGARLGARALNPVFQPLSIARMVWKTKVVIASIALIGCVLSAFVVRRMPPVYVSEALVLIDSQKISEKFVPSTVSTELQDRIATISQQILSTSQLGKIISDFDLYHKERKAMFSQDLLARMRRDISIQMDRTWSNKPGAFRVSYQGRDPQVVAQVANRIANLYIEENFKTRETQAESTSEFIDRQLAEAKTRLDQLEAAVGQYKLKYNGELPEQQGALVSTLGRLEVELETNRDALNRAQESKAMLESNLASTEASLQAMAEASDRTMEPLAQPAAGVDGTHPPKQSEQLEEQLHALTSRYGPNYPDVKRLEAELALVKAAEAAQPAPAPPGTPRNAGPPAKESSGASSRERLASLKMQIGVAQKEMEFQTQEQARITSEMKENSERINRLPLREHEMAQVTRDYEISKTNYQNLLDKKLAAEMATDLEHGQSPERFILLNPAPVPEKPERPKKPLLYALGGLMSLLAGLVAGVGLEMQQGKLLGQWELGSHIPVLARLPNIVPSRVVAE